MKKCIKRSGIIAFVILVLILSKSIYQQVFGKKVTIVMF